MRRVHLYILAGSLTALALAFFFYKIMVFGFPLKPEARTDIWRVEIQLQFEADGGPVKASLFLPQRTGALMLLDQSFVSAGYGLTTEPQRGIGSRVIYTVREAKGLQTLYYRAVLQSGGLRNEQEHDPRPSVEAPALARPQLAAAQTIVGAVQRQSADAATFAALLVKRLKEASSGDEADFLLGYQPSNRRLVIVAVQLLQLAGIPARAVNGIALAPERRNAQIHRWIEYHDKGHWRTLYVRDVGQQPDQVLLPWWRGTAPLAEVSGGKNLRHTISTSRSFEYAVRSALAQQRALEKRFIEFSLFGLPLQAQSLFRTILVIPVGILLLVVLRNIVGVKTFGTFMPVLIALSFRATGVFWGVFFLSIVVGLGLGVRFYLERLKLLLVPRLAAIVIVVIMLLATLTVLSFHLGFDRGLSIGLFPIVILTMTIERMTLVWEERGAAEAFQQAAGSIFVGVLCFLLMNVRVVEHLAFVFPELLLIVLAATLLLGRYTGYRLTELRRFKVLAR
ncbi:MAG: UUP1 family membrane protein [Betaproteobacteria bacterium]|nr:UUP1 family membrane protein [Betaproteobacteria bacterium]MDH3435811.1 UUP1 family membrane protein [Betaproteobacteria bacterium]